MKVKVSRNLFIVFVIDVALLCGSFYMAHLIRFDFDLPKWAMERFLEILPFMLIGKLVCFSFFDLYKGMWRYTGLNDLINIIKASTAATFLLIVFVLYKNRFEMTSRSVFIIDWCLTIMTVIGLRVLTRLCFEQFTENIGLQDFVDALSKIFRNGKAKGRGVLIIGAGDCGEKICREFKENPTVQSSVIGFLDDDARKIGRKIHGISVLGMIDELEYIVNSTGVRNVIIAIPSAGAQKMRQIVGLCKDAGVDFKTVPNMGELIDGRISINAIRNVEYRDLLGREPVTLDKEEIGRYLTDKTVLVTGAAGSIGTGLCRQICRYSPGRIVLLERAESPLFDLDIELKKNFPRIDAVPVLGDIQNREELEKVFEWIKPDIVFHAAAYKHVPMLEVYPWKAIENNVFGTKNLVELAHLYDVEKFVFVSTDKAVNPFNIMGASKRVSEMIVQSENLVNGSPTQFVTVRFGNVIGSVGSVIPLFKKQIHEGGPVTVTHPEIIRYFMLIPEACQLILQAGAMGKGGEIFILEMGKPIKIDNMARDLIKLLGFKPDIDIKIKYIGLRPGEKLYEELMTDQENVVPTAHEKIMVLKGTGVDLKNLDKNLSALSNEGRQRNKLNIKNIFKEIVPEYKPEAV